LEFERRTERDFEGGDAGVFAGVTDDLGGSGVSGRPERQEV